MDYMENPYLHELRETLRKHEQKIKQVQESIIRQLEEMDKVARARDVVIEEIEKVKNRANEE